MTFRVCRRAPVVATIVLITIAGMPPRPLPLAFDTRLIAQSATPAVAPQRPVPPPASTPPTAPTTEGPRLIGTFLQPRLDQRWTEDALRSLFLDFRRLGVSHVVVQWTVVGTGAF